MNRKTFYDSWHEVDEASVLVDQASKGFTKDANTTSAKIGVKPTGYTPSAAVKVVQRDESVYSAIVTKVDATMRPGWYLTTSNKRQKEDAQRFFEEIGFDLILRHLAFNLYPLGNAFLEIEREDQGDPESDPVDLHVLETTEMEIVDVEGHGEVDQYVQRHFGKKVEFEPHEVTHFRLDRFTSSLWGEIPIRPLDQLVGTKMEVKDHMWRLFHDNLFRETIKFPENTSDEDVNRSIAEYKSTQKDRTKPYIWFGDGVEHEFLTQFEDGPRFLELINHIDHAILVQMQVPPIMAGIPDESGRASGEQQTYKAFNTHIRSSQKFIEETINHDLLPKLGFPSVKFHFGSLDQKSEKDVLEMAERLKTMGAKKDKLQEWLDDNGISLPADFFQDEAFDLSQGSQEKSEDMFPSRQRQNDGEMNERVGTGSEGETREDQLVTQALDKYQIRDPSVEDRATRLMEKINELSD